MAPRKNIQPTQEDPVAESTEPTPDDTPEVVPDPVVPDVTYAQHDENDAPAPEPTQDDDLSTPVEVAPVDPPNTETIPPDPETTLMPTPTAPQAVPQTATNVEVEPVELDPVETAVMRMIEDNARPAENPDFAPLSNEEIEERVAAMTEQNSTPAPNPGEEGARRMAEAAKAEEGDPTPVVKDGGKTVIYPSTANDED